jgi:RNA polymerase sigma-70 factor (ECF subfamily)
MRLGRNEGMERNGDPAPKRSIGPSRDRPIAGAVDLIERVRSHDEVAFRSLVETYQSEIFAFTRAVTGDENEADNLAQKIFVRAYRDPGPRDASMAVTTWLYRLTFEECVVESRLNTLRRALQALQATFVSRTGGHADTTTSAQANRQTAIRDALQVLSPKARVLLLLREVAHQSVSELAQIIGCDARSIRKQLLKARCCLSIALQHMESRGV